MAITTVFLDWGESLAHLPEDKAQPWRVWARVLSENGYTISDDALRPAIDSANRELGPRIYEYVGRTSEFWVLHDDRVLDNLGIRSRRELIIESIQAIYDDPSDIRLFPEVPAALTALRERGYRLGLISNHHDGLRRVLKYHHLETRFDTITYSQEAGAEKPDPRIFDLALRRAGCRPGDAVHAGDSLEADVEGARRSGIAPIWINRSSVDRFPGCPVVRSLEELAPVVDEIDRSTGSSGPVRDSR